MANEYVNIFEVSGAPSNVAALAAKADLSEGRFLMSLVGEGSSLPERDAIRDVYEVTRDEMDDPATTDEVAQGYVVVTRGGAPEEYAKEIAEGHPDLTFRLASVDPGMRVAQVLVLRGTEVWSHEPEVDWDSLDEEAPEDDVLDLLMSDSESVADDYRKRGTTPSPR